MGSIVLCNSYDFSEQDLFSLISFCSRDQCLVHLPRYLAHTSQKEKPDAIVNSAGKKAKTLWAFHK